MSHQKKDKKPVVRQVAIHALCNDFSTAHFMFLEMLAKWWSDCVPDDRREQTRFSKKGVLRWYLQVAPILHDWFTASNSVLGPDLSAITRTQTYFSEVTTDRIYLDDEVLQVFRNPRFGGRFDHNFYVLRIDGYGNHITCY